MGTSTEESRDALFHDNRPRLEPRRESREQMPATENARLFSETAESETESHDGPRGRYGRYHIARDRRGSSERGCDQPTTLYRADNECAVRYRFDRNDAEMKIQYWILALEVDFVCRHIPRAQWTRRICSQFASKHFKEVSRYASWCYDDFRAKIIELF